MVEFKQLEKEKHTSGKINDNFMYYVIKKANVNKKLLTQFMSIRDKRDNKRYYILSEEQLSMMVNKLKENKND